MCVIIAREPKVDIEFDKIEAGCRSNEDGWGMAVADRGRLVVERHYDKKGNDPEKVIKALEDAKDQKVYLHLRKATHGKLNTSMCHPFEVLTNKSHGTQIGLMHNGVMSEFSDTKNEFSDTAMFVNLIVKPLLERTLKTTGSHEGLLKDRLIKEILQKYAGSYNYFVLVDKFGNELIINRSGGKDFDGWWTSNPGSLRAYSSWPSFQGHAISDSERFKSTDTTGRAPWADEYEDDNDEDEGVFYGLPGKNNGQYPGFIDYKDVNVVGAKVLSKLRGEPVEEEDVVDAEFEEVVITEKLRDRFLPSNISLMDLNQLTRFQVESLCDRYPEEAALLIMDLLEHLEVQLNISKYKKGKSNGKEEVRAL